MTLGTLQNACATIFNTRSAFRRIVRIVLSTDHHFNEVMVRIISISISRLINFNGAFQRRVFVYVIFNCFQNRYRRLSNKDVATRVNITRISVIFIGDCSAIRRVLRLNLFISFNVSPFPVSSVLFNRFQAGLRRLFFCRILGFFCHGNEEYGLSSCVRHSIDGRLLFVVSSYNAGHF